MLARSSMDGVFIAITIIVDPAQSSSRQPAEPTSQPSNKAVQSQLPFSDRPRLRGRDAWFIATTPDAANQSATHFLNTRRRRPVNQSLASGATQHHKRLLRSRRQFIRSAVSRSDMTIVEGKTGPHRHRHTQYNPEQRAELSTFILRTSAQPVVSVIYSHVTPTTRAA